MEKKKALDGSIYYQEGKEEYRRVVGGLAWSGVKPGFAVVVAESFKAPGAKVYPYHVLAEAEEMGVDRLFMKCFELQHRWGVSEWFGQADNTPMMTLVDRFNGRLEERGIKAGVYVQYAPFVEEPACFKYYTDILLGRVNSKSLLIGNDKLLSVYLFNLRHEDRVSASPVDFPAVAALGFAVAALETYEPVVPGSLPEKAESDWNLFEV